LVKVSMLPTAPASGGTCATATLLELLPPVGGNDSVMAVSPFTLR
jgi:hypothetical protein